MSKKKPIKLNELDINNIGGWPQQAKVGLCVIIVVLIQSPRVHAIARRLTRGRRSTPTAPELRTEAEVAP